MNPLSLSPQQQTILKRIQTLCSENIGIDPKEVTPKADLRDDLGLSLPELAHIFTGLQHTFAFTVPSDAMKGTLENLVTVEDLMSFVEDELEL